MAKRAMTQETFAALRQQIARIEERPLGSFGKEPLAAGQPAAGPLMTGASRLDAALGGGLARAALAEIHAAETRDAGAAAGFALALASRLLVAGSRPLLWIGTAEVFSEAGFPYPPGLVGTFGLPPERLLFTEAAKLSDALWVAEEAAVEALAMVVIELRGNPARLDLTATRRLHRRAMTSGHPLLLLREAAEPEPTAAPFRLSVAPAPAALRTLLSGPLEGSIGRPAFTVTLSKAPAGRQGRFTVEWNSHERIFEERQDFGAVVPLSRHGAASGPAAGQLVAFEPGAARAAGRRPARHERLAHRGTRRAG